MLKTVPSLMSHVLELSSYMIELGGRSKRATTQRDNFAGRLVKLGVFCSTSIFHQQAVEAAVCGFPYGAADANISGYASNDQVLYALIPEQKLKIRV